MPPAPADLVEYVLLGPPGGRALLQDTPILGDVWLAYAAQPGVRLNLLITPLRSAVAADVADAVASGVGDKSEARIAYLQGIVAASLTLPELLRVVVPITGWWEGLPEEDRSRSPALALQAVFGAGLPVRPFDRLLALASLLLYAEANPVTLATAAGSIPAMASALAEHVPKNSPRGASVHQVSLDRRPFTALADSVPAVKADAGRRLFDIKCEKITWAVIDAGIDRDHEALALRNDAPRPESRVVKTLDFTNLRTLLDRNVAAIGDATLGELIDGVDLETVVPAVRLARARALLSHIVDEVRARRPTPWATVETLITLQTPKAPVSPHGTHVAGIIGADPGACRPPDTHHGGGMCPDILFYDLRVLAHDASDTEFAIIAALQYVRWLNDRHASTIIHGVNISLSIAHNVRNYACGRTPVCNECERLVENGVVVVAAAGNRGHQRYQTQDGVYEGTAAFSVTDPGNSPGVLTVGSTHGNWPHTYGVSYFSSRGPTGDGRMKPDLVAPGERITSTMPGRAAWGELTGTSMAAPHVSGAAALLMARYGELVGDPRRVKQILCDSATDLGRERSFQGNGMLDVLRALQSI